MIGAQISCHTLVRGPDISPNMIKFNLIYLFMSRHEVHSMNTHTLQNAG